METHLLLCEPSAHAWPPRFALTLPASRVAAHVGFRAHTIMQHGDRNFHGSTRPCKFFLEGTCRYGSSCRFRHASPPPVPREPTLASSLGTSHPLPLDAPLAPPLPPGPPPPSKIWEEVLGMQPLSEIAEKYYNLPREQEEMRPAWRDSMTGALPEPRLELLEAKDAGARGEGKKTCHYVFRSVVAQTHSSWVELDGSVHLPLRLVQERCLGGRLRKDDLITGRMVRNGDPRLGCAWFCIHVLRINTGLRLLREERSQASAASVSALSCLATSSAEAILDDGDGAALTSPTTSALPSAGPESGHQSGLQPESEVVVSQLMIDQAQRHADENTEKRERGQVANEIATAEEIAAGLAIGKTLEDGKIRFQGVVTSMIDEDGAAVSRTVYVHRQYVRSKWGALSVGDNVCGLMVPVPVAGCRWRCIHVTTVDPGGRNKMRMHKQEAERLAAARAAEERAYEERRQELASHDHKGEIEKLKAQMAAKREAERTRREEERQERLKARAKSANGERRD